MPPKAELLKQAEEEFQALKAALDRLSERQLTEVWLGSWSIKEIVAHMSGWHYELGPALERLARGEKPIPEGVSYDDPDPWNAKFVAARNNTPVAQVMKELEASHTYFMAQAAKIPEERFVPGKTAYKLVDMITAHHYKEHGDQIRAWRHSKGI